MREKFELNSDKTFRNTKNIINQMFHDEIRIISVLIFIIMIFSISSKEYMNAIIQHKSHYISLKILGTGKKRVFHAKNSYEGCKAFNTPNQVEINNIAQNEIKYEYNFNESINFIKLIWNDKVNSTVCLFYTCEDIYEIDFSHFDSSSIRGEITGMFYDCKSLISLDLSNFNSSRVTKISNLFFNCYSLTSINLSNFSTSNVKGMSNMFHECKTLSFINLSSFDTSKVESMMSTFFNCELLTSIVLSNFNTSKVTTMSRMFSGCKSLKFINFSNFNTPLLTDTSFMFQYCENLTSVIYQVLTFQKLHLCL